MKLNITIIGLIIIIRKKTLQIAGVLQKKIIIIKLDIIYYIYSIFIFLNAYEWFTFELSNPFASNIL